MNSRLICLLIFLSTWVPFAQARAQQSAIDVFADPTVIAGAAISPSGDRVALRRSTDERDVLVVLDRHTGEMLGGADIERVSERILRFVGEDHVLLMSPNTFASTPAPSTDAYVAPLVFDVPSKRIEALIRFRGRLRPSSTLSSAIAGVSADASVVYVPAWVRSEPDRLTVPFVSARGILAAPAAGGDAEIIAETGIGAENVFVDRDGQFIALEQRYDGRRYVWSFEDGEATLVHDAVENTTGTLGLTPDGDALIALPRDERGNSYCCEELSLADGKIRESMISRQNALPYRVHSDLNHRVVGVEYLGRSSRGEFFEGKIKHAMTNAQSSFPEADVSLVDWTPDQEQVLIRVSGSNVPGDYYVFATATAALQLVIRTSPPVPAKFRSKTLTIRHETHDGIPTESRVTIREGSVADAPQPLVVLLQDDRLLGTPLVSNWLEQFLAAEGYVVLRPEIQFMHRLRTIELPISLPAFFGTGVTDVQTSMARLTEDMNIDVDRVCVIGTGYSGFLALLLSAHSTTQHECVVSVGGPTDVEALLHDQLDLSRSARPSLEELLGPDPLSESALEPISLLHDSKLFKVPVLLIHAEDDPRIAFRHSRKLWHTLAGLRPVELVTLKGEGIEAPATNNRRETLLAISAFLSRELDSP